MKFVQYVRKSRPDDVRLGYLDEGCIVDVQCRDYELPKTMIAFLQNDYFLKRLYHIKNREPSCHIPLNKVTLKAPITGMDKIFGLGYNYKDLCEIHKITPPSVPIFFNKFSSTIIGPNDVLKIRYDLCKKVDYEVELCVIMGKKATFVDREDAYNYVFGYTIAQDISARHWQKDGNCGQFLLGKSLDTFCPIGPCIVTGDEIGDPENLEMSCIVNNVCRQKGNSCNLIYKIPALIERLTTVMTLLPGDMILTGTPAGPGVYQHPQQFLKPGDVIVSEIENIGVLETRAVQYVKPEEPFKPHRQDLLHIKC